MKTLKLSNKMIASGDKSRTGDFQYSDHDSEHVRVWRTSWFDDQFEILTHAEFKEFRNWCLRFTMQVVKADDE